MWRYLCGRLFVCLCVVYVCVVHECMYDIEFVSLIQIHAKYDDNDDGACWLKPSHLFLQFFSCCSFATLISIYLFFVKFKLEHNDIGC